MRANRTLEIGTGFFVLLGFAALAFLTTQLPSSGIKLNGSKAGYRVTAKFDNVGDLKPGAPVSMAGVNVGEVESIRFDPKIYRAVVTLRFDSDYSTIPDDSDAAIQTQGLLGGKYIGLSPGGSETYLKAGSEIMYTQSAIVLEKLINQFVANLGKGGDSSGGSAPAAQGSDDSKETQK